MTKFYSFSEMEKLYRNINKACFLLIDSDIVTCNERAYLLYEPNGSMQHKAVMKFGRLCDMYKSRRLRQAVKNAVTNIIGGELKEDGQLVIGTINFIREGEYIRHEYMAPIMI